MLIYIILFVLLAVIAVEYDLAPFNDKYLSVFIIVVLGLFAGLRGENVTRDYINYQIIFDFIYDLTSANDGSFLPVFEPGFVGLVIVFRRLFDVNYVLAVMVFYGLITLALKVFFIRRLSPFPYLAILFYFSYYFFLHEMTQIRIGFASAIFFGSLVFYLKDQRGKFILLVILATFFHYSALLYLLLLLFNPKCLNKYVYIFIIGISLILAVLKIPLLNFLGAIDLGDVSGKLSNYGEMVESGSVENIRFFNSLMILNIAICLYFLFAIPKRLLIEDKLIALCLKCSVLSVFFLAALSGVPSVAFRFSELFGVAYIFLYASLVKYLPFGKFNILVTILIAGLIFYTIVFHTDLVKPYYFKTIE